MVNFNKNLVIKIRIWKIVDKSLVNLKPDLVNFNQNLINLNRDLVNKIPDLINFDQNLVNLNPDDNPDIMANLNPYPPILPTY